MVTIGEHHLRMWSFRRPTKDLPASLNYKSGTMGAKVRLPNYLFRAC
jgi:hypothetical protein